MELKEIIGKDNPKHLYPFMQFLKHEGAINVLQFFLACGKFSHVLSIWAENPVFPNTIYSGMSHGLNTENVFNVTTLFLV